MQREINFRIWYPYQRKMMNWSEIKGKLMQVLEHTSCPVMQCIGLKDKNGKELYQNDIIKYISENDGETVFISEVDANLYVGLLVKSDRLTFEFDMYEYGLSEGNFEIIGNIYENPELLHTGA